MAKKKAVKPQTKKGVFDDIPEENDIPSSEDTFFKNESEGNYQNPPLEGKKMHRVQTFTMPGDEPLMEAIENRQTVKVTNKIFSPCPKEGVILVFMEYDEFI